MGCARFLGSQARFAADRHVSRIRCHCDRRAPRESSLRASPLSRATRRIAARRNLVYRRLRIYSRQASRTALSRGKDSGALHRRGYETLLAGAGRTGLHRLVRWPPGREKRSGISDSRDGRGAERGARHRTRYHRRWCVAPEILEKLASENLCGAYRFLGVQPPNVVRESLVTVPACSAPRAFARGLGKKKRSEWCSRKTRRPWKRR